jgi:hypothetical protein
VPKDWIVCKHSGRYIAFGDVSSIHQVVWKLFRFRLALNGYRICRRAIGQECQALTPRHFKYGSTALNGRVKSNDCAGEMMRASRLMSLSKADLASMVFVIVRLFYRKKQGYLMHVNDGRGEITSLLLLRSCRLSTTHRQMSRTTTDGAKLTGFASQGLLGYL